MSEEKHGDDCECDKPEILEKFNGKCSDEQIIKCHGREALDRYKREGNM